MINHFKIKMTIQLEKICRTCMSDKKTMISIWSDEESTEAASIATMLKAFVNHDVSVNDQLPKMMCLSCVSELNQAYAFKQKCVRSETTLFSCIKQMKTVPIDASTSSSIVWSEDEIESETIEELQSPSSVQDEHIVADNIPTEQIIYQCVNCLKEFDSNVAIEQHLCTAQKIQYIETEQDTQSISLKSDQIQVDHLLDENVKKFICNHCNGTFISQRSLSLHTNSKRCMQESFECDICQKVFVQKRYLIKHLRRMHKKPTEEANTKNDSDDESDAKKKYKCTVCSKGFTMLSSLKDHSRIHTGFRPFLCSTCGKGFTQASNLRQHQMRHNQNKPFKCSKCPSSFVSKGELVTHDRSHTKDHPFVCEICDTGFTTSSSLVKHRRIHTGERPYNCDLCPLRFTALNTMKNHRRTHTGEKPYLCGYIGCKKAFSQRSDCVSHLRTHKGDKSFECDQCKVTFRRESFLRTHKKKCSINNMAKDDTEKVKCS